MMSPTFMFKEQIQKQQVQFNLIFALFILLLYSNYYMREVVNVQIGQCGNQVGAKFWQVISEQHGIVPNGQYQGDSDLQLQKINVYYNQAKGGRYLPRSVLVDLDPGLLNSIRASPYGNLFNSDNYITGGSSAGNNWAKGHYCEGAQLIDEVLNVIRKQAQQSQSLQGFQIVHSIAGGTGGGTGTLIINKIRQEYPDQIMASFTIIPSTKISDTVVQPYNAILSINQLIQNTDQSLVLDNEAIYNICYRKLKIQKPVYADLNHLVANAISNYTCTIRFPGLLNTDFRKLAVNLVPFPKLHFMMMSMAPMISRNCGRFRALTVPQLVHQIFEPDNMTCSVQKKYGKYFAAYILFRGRMSHRGQIPYQMQNAIEKNKSHFIEWIPDSTKYSFIDIPPRGIKLIATMLVNSTAVSEMFKRIDQQFFGMFRRRAFLHQYLQQGMDQIQFVQAECNILDLIYDYQQYEDCIGDGQPFDQQQQEQ